MERIFGPAKGRFSRFDLTSARCLLFYRAFLMQWADSARPVQPGRRKYVVSIPRCDSNRWPFAVHLEGMTCVASGLSRVRLSPPIFETRFQEMAIMKWTTLIAAALFCCASATDAMAFHWHRSSCCGSAPSCCAPAPTCAAPAPTCCAPAPTCAAPAASCCAPAQSCCRQSCCKQKCCKPKCCKVKCHKVKCCKPKCNSCCAPAPTCAAPVAPTCAAPTCAAPATY